MYSKYYCVVCGKKELQEKEIILDLGNFNSAVCKKCEDTEEGKETLADYL